MIGRGRSCLFGKTPIDVISGQPLNVDCFFQGYFRPDNSGLVLFAAFGIYRLSPQQNFTVSVMCVPHNPAVAANEPFLTLEKSRVVSQRVVMFHIMAPALTLLP